MKEELETYRNKDKNKNKVLFFDFNPWIYSKRSNLTSEYINTLQKKLHPLLTPPLWKKWEEKVGELFEAKTID